MPTQADDDQYCVYQDDTGEKRFRITGTEDAATCRRWQGEITTDPGPQAPSPPRISALTLREQLSGTNWAEPVADSHLQMRDFGTLLLSFPLCEAYRRFPEAPLVEALNRLDSGFTKEIRTLLARDPGLGDRVRQLVVRGASTVAAALAWAGTGADQPVGEDLFEFAQRLADDVVSLDGDRGLAEAIGAALRAAEPLRGVALTDALSAVARTAQSSSSS